MAADHLTRILDEICSQRGRPKMIRSDNGAEFTGKAMLTWAHRNGIALRLIEPGKPNPDCLGRIVKRTIAVRMPERELVHQPNPRARSDRDMAR